MSCGCGDKKQRQFEHIAKDGKVTIVKTQMEAIRLTREHGGTWHLKTA